MLCCVLFRSVIFCPDKSNENLLLDVCMYPTCTADRDNTAAMHAFISADMKGGERGYHEDDKFRMRLVKVSD